MLYSKEQHVRTIGVTQWVFAIKWIFKMKNYGPTVFTVGPVPIAIGIEGTGEDSRASGGNHHFLLVKILFSLVPPYILLNTVVLAYYFVLVNKF